MRFWIDFPRVGPFRPGVLFGLGDIGGSRRSPHPVIVTDSMRTPSSSFSKPFFGLIVNSAQRLVQRLKWRLDGLPKPPGLKGPR